MPYKLVFTDEARDQLGRLQSDPKKLKRVRKCLGLLETNPKHPSLHSHKYEVMKIPDGRAVWESYVENKTPAAWRVFWAFGPDKTQMTIIAITEHP